jgi:hypothetical protein
VLAPSFVFGILRIRLGSALHDDGMNSVVEFYRLGVAHISMLKALEIRNFSF